MTVNHIVMNGGGTVVMADAGDEPSLRSVVVFAYPSAEELDTLLFEADISRVALSQTRRSPAGVAT